MSRLLRRLSVPGHVPEVDGVASGQRLRQGPPEIGRPRRAVAEDHRRSVSRTAPPHRSAAPRVHLGQHPADAARCACSDDGERQQPATGGTDLDLGVHLRADAAVVAGGPAAVLDVGYGVGVLGDGEGVLPVGPEPVLVEAGVEVVPGQDLVVVALADGVPVEVDAGAGQGALAGGDPAVVGEVLAPAVEAAAVAPDLLDDPADAAVAAGQQSLDGAGLAVVVAEPDGAAVPLVGADDVAQLLAAARRWSRGRAGRPTGTACAAWARSRRSRRCSGCRCGPSPRGPWRSPWWRGRRSRARPRRSRSGGRT